MNNKRLISIVLFACVLGGAKSRNCVGQTNQDLQVVAVLSEVDQPFLFAYLSWEGKANVIDGVAVIRETNNRGGAGVNQSLDLSVFASLSPAIRVRIRPANEMQKLRWMVADAAGHQAIWEFELKVAQDSWQWITPVNGASVTQPNSNSEEKPGNPDLSDITQWQLMGDWVGDVAVDVEIDQIAVVEPNTEMLGQRAEMARVTADNERQKNEERSNLIQRYSYVTTDSPQLIHTSVMIGNILCLEIAAGQLIPASLYRYEPLATDQQVESYEFGEKVITVQRNGTEIGWLVADQREWLASWERIKRDPLLDFIADLPQTYSITSVDDPDFRQPQQPTAVSRKSMPHAWATGSNEVGVKHTLFLTMEQTFKNGKTYRVSFEKLNVYSASREFKYQVTQVLSPAVHVHQIGYRPDDPHKTAFVSCWLGSGGTLSLPRGLRFAILEDVTGKKVYEGVGSVDFQATRDERMMPSKPLIGMALKRAGYTTAHVGMWLERQDIRLRLMSDSISHSSTRSDATIPRSMTQGGRRSEAK